MARSWLFPVVAFFGAPLLAFACSAAGDDDGTSSSSNSGGAGSGGFGGNLDTDGGSSFGDANCGSSTYANAVPAAVLVTLDKSGSMAGGDGQPDKWGPTVSALNAMMSAASPTLQVGLLPFPAGNFDDSALLACLASPSTPGCDAIFADGGCMDVSSSPAVEVGPLSTTQGPISSWLSGSSPGGNTPTLFALKTAYEHMRGLSVEGERYVLLMTDGEPNTHQAEMTFGMFTIPESNIECKTLEDIEAEALVAAMGTPPVKTFVIGSPGSEGAATFLSQVALNGDTPRTATCSPAVGDCHYQIGAVNYQADLQAALDEIAGQITDCIFEIPEGNEMVDPDLVNVQVESSAGVTDVYKDPTHQDGWDYTDDTKTKIQLFGPACEQLKSEVGNKVNIVLGCQTVVK